MAKLGKFIALQVALGVYLLISFFELDTLTASGEWKLAGNWTPGKPAGTGEALIPAGKEVKILTEAQCRSMIVEGAVSGTSVLTKTGAEPTEAAFKGVALKILSGADVSKWTGVILFSQSGGIKTLGFWTGGHTMQNSLISFNRGSWQLEEDLVMLSTAKAEVSTTEATLILGGHNLSTGTFIIGSSGILTAGSSVIKLTSVGIEETSPVWRGVAGASVGSATFELTDISETLKIFRAGALTYGTLTFAGPNTELTEGGTTGILNVNNKGAAATKGLRLQVGKTLNVTTLTFNGSGTERSRLESNKTGEAATIKIPSSMSVGGAVAVKDITVTGGTLTLTDPNAKDEGGNTGINFPKAYERTLSVSQEFLVTTPKRPELVRAVSIPQGATFSKQPRLSRSVTQGQTVSQGKFIQKTLGLSQGQNVIFTKTLQKLLTIGVVQTTSAAVSKGIEKALPVSQSQVATSSKTPSYSFPVSQGQIVSSQKQPGRFLEILQGQTANLKLTSENLLPVNQNLSVVVTRGLEKHFSITQGQAASLNKKAGKKFQPTQEQNVALTKSLPFTFTISQGQTLSILKSVPKILTAVQEQAVSFVKELKTAETFHTVTFLVTQSQSADFEKLTQKVLLIPQSISISSSKGITRALSVIQGTNVSNKKFVTLGAIKVAVGQTVAAEWAKKFLYTVEFNLLQSINAEPKREVKTTVPIVLQSQRATVGKGYKITFHVLVGTATRLAKAVKTTLSTIAQPQAVQTISSRIHEISSGRILWVVNDDTIDSNRDQVVEFEGNKATAVDELGQLEAVITPGNPDVLSYVLRKPQKVRKGTTDDPAWQ